MPSSVACIAVRVASLTDVLPEIRPPLREITCCATSKTAIVILNVFENQSHCQKVLKTHLKNVHVSKFARLLCSMSIWISS